MFRSAWPSRAWQAVEDGMYPGNELDREPIRIELLMVEHATGIGRRLETLRTTTCRYAYSA